MPASRAFRARCARRASAAASLVHSPHSVCRQHTHSVHMSWQAFQRPMQWEAYKLPVTFSVPPPDICLGEFTSLPHALYLCTTAASNARTPGHVNACMVPELCPDRAKMRCTVQHMCLPDMQPSASSTATSRGHDPLMCKKSEKLSGHALPLQLISLGLRFAQQLGALVRQWRRPGQLSGNWPQRDRCRHSAQLIRYSAVTSAANKCKPCIVGLLECHACKRRLHGCSHSKPAGD